jgi:hypothetical protein
VYFYGRINALLVYPIAMQPCIYCGHPAEHTDHIVPRDKGGTDDPTNLAPTCKSCNSAKWTRSVEVFLRRYPEILDRVRRHQAGFDVLSNLTPGERPRSAVDTRKGMTLRLNPRAWTQLKLMAIESESRIPAHDLLIEAVNDLFRKYGKPPIASTLDDEDYEA